MVPVTLLPKKETAELLFFLADHESFSSSQQLLEGSISAAEIKSVLRELGTTLSHEAAKESLEETLDMTSTTLVTERTKEVLSLLSPDESKELLNAFRRYDCDEV